ncbi:hypothetical protein Bca52824_008904 [Brassica carinata]|uniref:Uncharacterized protein n=1 Tax=Brassica carinata TaxID=52824 RepID=A0A8X7WA25_BRACI|nr:hypothetical protein Bca52824_008904 [Brassica carinata]
MSSEEKNLIEILEEGHKVDIVKYIDYVSAPQAGAIATFSGTTRDMFEGKAVLELRYEAYNPNPAIHPSPPPIRYRVNSTETTSNHHHHSNKDHLLRVCTILYQQQNSPDSRLVSKLSSTEFQLTHEFFLQVCNNFPLSWRPVHRFFLYSQTHHSLGFSHTSVTYNKILGIIGKSRNMDLFWELAQETGKRGLANDKTFRVVLRTLASAREMKKCVSFSTS